MKRVVMCIVCLAVAFSTLVQSSAKAEIMPLSSDNFWRYSACFLDGGYVSFSANVYAECTSIKVVSCKLEKKSGSKWIFIKSLVCPASKANTSSYAVTKNYSSSLTKGDTYRVVVTFEADKEQVTTTSTAYTY